jgi:hypothetical protein
VRYNCSLLLYNLLSNSIAGMSCSIRCKSKVRLGMRPLGFICPAQIGPATHRLPSRDACPTQAAAGAPAGPAFFCAGSPISFTIMASGTSSPLGTRVGRRQCRGQRAPPPLMACLPGQHPAEVLLQVQRVPDLDHTSRRSRQSWTRRRCHNDDESAPPSPTSV